MKHKVVWEQPISVKTEDRLKTYIDYERLKDKEDLAILDFGCGNGRYMRLFSKWFPQATIHGVDSDKESVEALRDEFPEARHISPLEVDLSYDNNFFDLIYSSNVIEHIPRKLCADYLVRLNELLKPDGSFVGCTPNYPYKRFYDMVKAVKYSLKGDLISARYYLLDDPTHSNKLGRLSLLRVLACFDNVGLLPSNKSFGSSTCFCDKIVFICDKGGVM